MNQHTEALKEPVKQNRTDNYQTQEKEAVKKEEKKIERQPTSTVHLLATAASANQRQIDCKFIHWMSSVQCLVGPC